MNEHDPSEWLASIAEIFDDLGVAWTLVGALAANRYRVEPRFTTDVDVLAGSHPDVVDRLRAAGYSVDEIADIDEPAHLLRCHRGPEQIDVLLAVVEYQVMALERAIDHRLTVEDVIVHKLIAWRMRDRDDIRSILAGEPLLDSAYLERWVTEWDVQDRWDQSQRDR